MKLKKPDFKRYYKTRVNLKEVHVYTQDLEAMTVLRDKAFKRFDTVEGKAEWERYNHILEVMEKVMFKLMGSGK